MLYKYYFVSHNENIISYNIYYLILIDYNNILMLIKYYENIILFYIVILYNVVKILFHLRRLFSVRSLTLSRLFE